MEFFVNSARQVTFRGPSAHAQIYISRCDRLISTADRSEQSPVFEECTRNGWRSIAFGQPVTLFRSTSATSYLTRDYRGIGELIVRIAYADALTKEEANDLMKKNEESVRRTTEALARIYLVNFIPIRALMSTLIKPLIHLAIQSSISLLGYQALGSRG